VSDAGAYRIQSPAGHGTYISLSVLQPLVNIYRAHSRSLSSCEALEEHFCVAVDAQVLDRVRIRGRARRILACRGFLERGAQRASEGLHRDNGVVTKTSCREGLGIWFSVGETDGWAEVRSATPVVLRDLLGSR
jgi:hypothetical protein